jgi:DNA-binding Xre family transcriptional regulator
VRCSKDIHLDIDAFLSVIEPAEKQKFAAIKLKHDKIFGQAIASLRKQYQLRQSDIIGLSERQVSRIEQGKGTRLETLNLFAQAHKMELNDYLDAVAQLIDKTSAEYPHGLRCR